MSHHDSFDLKPDAGSSAAQNSLLRLPAVADNAAMEAEPSKRKRRCFQFSLGTVLSRPPRLRSRQTHRHTQ
jgi:hypothetical protein